MASGQNGQLVLVTGASGFIATHVIKLLQEEGYRVRSTVRDLKNEEKIKVLKDLCPDARYPLELVEADLTNADCWKEAVKNCTYVMHVASPFPNGPPDQEESIINPAVNGTKNVLQACADAGTVKRVVLTSSIVAIYDTTLPAESCNNQNGGVKTFTEDDWMDTEVAGVDAYAKSKAMAEKAAWDFVKELPEEKKFELAVVNPALVFGPILIGSYGTSVELIKRLLERNPPLLARLNFSVCDVRDVALAHLKAMTVPEAAGHRHIVVTQSVWMRDIALVLSKEFKSQGYWIPTITAPYIAVWLNSFFDKSVKMVLPRLGREIHFSNKRMKEVLGITPRELEKTLVDTAYSLIERGVVKKTKKYHCKDKKDGQAGECAGEEKQQVEEAGKEQKEEEEKEEAEPKKEEGDVAVEDVEEHEPETKPQKVVDSSEEIPEPQLAAANQ